MAKREQIIIDGQPIGRLKASWILFKESWRYLKADKEMVWMPLITALINLLLFGVLVTVFILFTQGEDFSLSGEDEPLSAVELVFMFLVYVIGAFTLALSQAGISNTVYTRAHGGDATLGQSLKVAFSNWAPLLLWSIITSTVGILLRMIAERSGLLGRLVVLVLGVAWSVLTYFVVPAIVIDKKSAFGSISKSGQVFKATWGETLVSNFSLGLTFFVAHIVVLFSAIGLIVTVSALEVPALAFLVVGVYVIWIVTASLVQSALEGVLKTLLYIYATEGNPPQNFNQELLDKMLVRANPVTKLPPTQPNANLGV